MKTKPTKIPSVPVSATNFDSEEREPEEVSVKSMQLDQDFLKDRKQPFLQKRNGWR